MHSLSDFRSAPPMLPKHLPALITLCAVLAALLAFAVARDATAAFDLAVARLFSEGPLRLSAPVLREAIRDLTALGSFTVLGLAVLSACAFLGAAGRWPLAGLVLASSIGASLVSTLVKFGIARPRPDLGGPVVATFTPSFPSGHAFLSTVVFLTIGGLIAMAARNRREKVVILATALFLALSIGASRVVLGVHWLTDVTAGWLLGLAWSGMVLLLAQRLARPGETTLP